MRSFAVTALLAATATAHFNLNVPPSIFFDEDQEASGPCGGGMVGAITNATNFYTSGQSIAVNSGHPTVTYLFRVTTDLNVISNFTALSQPIQQSGLGKMCVPVSVPANLAGQKGYLQVVGDSPDGILYQCAQVNFVAGTAGANSACTNASGVTASFVMDSTLSALAQNAGNATANATTTNSTTASTTSTTAGTTSKAAAAALLQPMQGLMSVVVFGGIASAAFFAQLL